MSAKGSTGTTPRRQHTLTPPVVRAWESARLRQHTLIPRVNRARQRARCFSVDVTLGAYDLRETDPMALLLAALAEIPPLRHPLGVLEAILSELYCNALEHGVLGLDSQWKRDAEGFERYVIEREERLARLRYGWIRIALNCSYGARRGVATIRVEDSGTGFDRKRLDLAAPDRKGTDVVAPDQTRLDERAPSPALHGRGLAVIRALGARLYTGKGRRGVCALYRWNG